MHWDVAQDNLHISTPINQEEQNNIVTKRIITSELYKNYLYPWSLRSSHYSIQSSPPISMAMANQMG